jgi:hypothetical protein
MVAALSDAAWVGYSVPTAADLRMCCCDGMKRSWDGGCCGRCSLEPGNGSCCATRDERAPVSSGVARLEGPYWMRVMLRAENRVVQKIRTFSDDCTIDAGGLEVRWLTEVKPAESVALLRALLENDSRYDGRDSSGIGQQALSAIAMHADASADAALESFVVPGRPEKLRADTAFWLGQARGARGFELLKRVLRQDPSPAVRERAVFGLYVSQQPGAEQEIIRATREDSSSRVRGQALFWLAQRAGQRAAGTITAAIEHDPDTDVKKKAVFALSQLPKDDGVPKLIEVARHNRNPAVRKQAMFWLGQSNDPRALAFFEEILKP